MEEKERETRDDLFRAIFILKKKYRFDFLKWDTPIQYPKTKSIVAQMENIAERYNYQRDYEDEYDLRNR